MKIIPDERDKVQKKTFTKWVNKHLIRARKHVTDLYEDLRDGHNLSTLLEVLSKDTLPRERGKMRFHRLQNIQIALDYLRQRQIKLVNIRSDDIADGNPKLTLGLIWTIILHFQISEVQVLGQSEDMTAKEKLLLWSQKMVNTYPGLQCGNFSTSWRDGRLFNAIIHRHRPDLVDMHMVEQQDNRQNLEQAFLIAEQELGVTRLLDPEDIDVSSPDEKSIITYVSSLYDVMPKIPDVVGGLTAEEANVKYKEYRELVSSLLMWILRQISIMEDRTFPDDLSTLKALYSNFVQFKSTEFEMKLTEKNKVEDIFRLLKPWFQSGRIHLDTGFHPDDVDLEWDKLVKAMEDRDTVLHFEIERLEMLHRIASLVGNDLTCSAQLLSKASAALQADIDLTTAGQQPKETAVISHYLSEIEVKIKKVFMDIQTLREGKHILAEEFYSRALTLHEKLTALRAEHGVLLDKAGRLQERATRETREAVARAVAEDESCLKFVHDLLKWLEDMQTRVGELDWGSDLPAVEKNMSDHKDLHRSIEEFRSSIEEAKASETKVSSSLQSEYMGILNKLELHHTKLLNSSRSRQRHLDSLYNFMLRATKELVWLNQKEEDEIGYDWSEHNTDMATKKKAYSELMQVLELKEPVLKGIQAMGEDLISDGHPAKGPIQAYSAVMNTQWNWLLQLCTSVETHLAGNSAFFKFFEDVKQNEEHLKHLQDSMWRRFGCNKSTSLIAVDNVLQACVDEKEKLMDYKSHVSELVSRSKKIVQLKQRSPDCGVRNPLPVKALCDYKQLEITLHKGEECALIDNSDPIKWTVLSSFGRKARIPSACFVIPPPNGDALDAAESMDKLYHDAIGFWHQLYGNLRCMLSWHHLQNTVASVRSWTFQEFRTLRPEEHSEVMHSLGTHYEEFVQISRDANLFGPADLGQAERDYNLCKQHYEQLLHKLKKEDADEAACQHLLAELRVISQRLESYEERMIRLIRTPLGPDAAPGVSSRIAEQQRLYSEVEGIRAGLDHTRESCTEVLARSPTVPSQPNLRSELSVVLQKAEDIYSLSSVYLEKLKTVDLVVKYLHDAESLVKSYETRLCAEEGVPAEPERVQQYIAQIKAWHAEANEELPLFHGLQEEVRRAQALNERMLVAHGERSVDLERFQERTEQLLQRWQGVHAQVDNRVRELEALSKVMSNYRTLRTELNVWLGAAVKQQDELQTSHTHDSHMLSQQLTRQKDLILDLDKHRAKLDECQRYSTEYYTRVKDYELQLMAYWTMVEKTPPKKKLLTSSADATNEEIMELRNRHSSQLSQAQEHEKFIEETLQRVQEEEAPRKVVLARHKVQEPFVQHASTVGVLIKHHQHATNTARGISKRTQPQGYLKEDVVTHGFVTGGLMKQQAAEVYVKEKSSDGIAEEKTIKGFVKEDVGVGFIKQTALKGVVKENVAERLAEQKTIGRVLEEGVEQLEKPKARKGMVKENIAKRFAERKAIGRVLEGAEGLAKQEAIEGLKEEETIEGLMVEDATVSFTKQEDAAELMKQKAAVKLELSALRLRSKKEMSHQTTLVVEALSQQQQTEADVAKLKGELENMAQQRVAFELELEQLRATADKATKQCEKATEEANRLRFQTEEEAQKRKEAEEELRLRKAAEEEANIAKNDALEKLEQVSKQAEEVMLNQKEAAKNVLHQEMLAETAVMEQKQAETELERGNSLHGESPNEGRAAEQKACEDLLAEVEDRKNIAKEADEARKAAESELETWRHRMDDALRLKALAEDSANEKRMAQKDAERQKEAAEMEARTRAESERIALEQRRKAEEECEKMRKLAEESSELKLAAETDVLHMRTSMDEVEQQRTALSEELTLVKQDMGQALNQKNMLEDELFQVKKQVQELMQCKVLAEEEIKKNSLQQSEMTQRALDEEATKLVNTIAEVARLKDMLDEMMLKRKQAEDEAAQQKAEVEHILEEKVTAIQAERHLKEEVERALLDRESEQKELRMMAEKEAQEHQRLVAEAADQQHSAEQELALLRLQFEGDLEKQRATLNDAVSQRHTIEGEIHTLHLAVTKTANEKTKLETELQCLRVAANEAAQQKAQAEVEAQRQKQLATEEADKKQKAEEEASRLAQAEKYSTNCYLEAMKELEDLRMKATEALKKKEEAEKEAAQQLELAKAATQKQLEAEEQARLAASQYKEGEIQQPQAEEQLYAQRLQKSAEQAQRLAEEVQLAKQKAEEQAFICQQQAQDVEVLRAKAENAAELAAQAQRDAEILRKQAENEAQNKVQAAQEAKQQQELAKRELEKQKQLVEVTGEQKVLVEQQLEKLQVQLQNSEKQQVVVEKELEKMKDEAKLAAKQNKHLEEEHVTIKIQLEELLVMKIKSQEEIQQLTETQEKEKRLLLEKEEEKVKVLAAEAEKLRADAEMSARLQKDVEEELFEQCKLAEKIMKEKTEALEKAKRAQQEVFEVHKHCEDAEKHLRTVASGHDKIEEQLRHDAEHHQKALQEELRKRTVLQAEAQQLKDVVDELTREHLQTQAEAQKAHAEAQEVSGKLMTLQEGIAHKANVCDAGVQKDNGEKLKPEAICFDIAVTAQPEFEDKSVMVDMTQTAEMPAGGAPDNVMVEAKEQEAQLESKTDSLMSVEVATQVAFEEASWAKSESEKEARLSESNLIHEAQTLRKRIEEETSKHNVEKETLMMQQNILEEQKLQLQKIFEDELKNAKALLDVETKKRRKQEEDNVHLCAQMQEALREQKRAQMDIQKKREKLLELEQQKALKEKKEWEEEHLLLKDQLKDQELQEKRSLEKQRLELAMLQSNVGKEVEQQNDSSVQSSFEIEKGEVSASTSVVKQATMTTTTTTTTTYMYSMKDTAKALEEVLITIPCGQMMGKTLTVWEVLHSSLIQESSSQNIISTYREGKTSTIKIIVIIVEIIEAGAAKTDRKKLISIRGIRHPVTLETLIQTGLLSEETAILVLNEKKTIEEVSESLKSCLQGTGTIAGVVVESTNEIMDVYRAMKVGLLKPGIALELLEAQAATGFLLSPLWNERLTVEQAAQKQLIGLDIKEKLLTAEKAVAGFKDLYTGKLLGIGQVLQKRESLRDLAVRLLEAQLATGGIIDPQLSVRLPLAVAHERGLLDAKMMQILTGGSCTARCYHDPMTDEMCSYKELLLKCRFVVGLHILPIKQVPKERKLSSKSSVRKRKVLIIDPDSGKDLSIYEAYRQSIIDWNTYQELIGQESEWEEIVTSSPEEGTLSSVLIDRKSGRQFDIQEALANGTLSQRSLERYRAGDLPVFELGAILTGKVKYPHTFPSEDNIQHLQQQPLAEHTEEIGPVAGIINVDNMEKMSVMEAMQRGLVNRSTGRRLLEAQACTGGIMDINTGQRLSTESALKADLIDTFLFDQLTVAEKAYCGFWDTETKSLIPPSQALLKDLLFPEMAMYLLQVQYITGGLVEPGKEEKKKRMSLSDFQEKGYIDVQTVQKLKDMTTYPKCLTCPKNKKYISFKEALDSSIVDPQTGLKFLEAIANGAAACIRDQTRSDSASGFSGGSGSNLPGNVPFGATEQGGHRQSRNGSSFEQESWSSNTRQMRFESSQMNEKGLPETPGPSTSLTLLAEGFSRNVEAENGGVTHNATTKYNQNIDQDNKTLPFLVDCSVLEGGVPSGTEHLKVFLTETPEYGQDGRLIDDGSSSFPLTHDPQGDFKVNFLGDGSMTERHNLTPGTEPFPVPNIIEYPPHSCPCAGDTLFTHSSRPNNVSIPEFSQYEHLRNNAVLQKQSFWAASATFNKLQTSSTNCPTAPRTCYKEDENISNVDNKRKIRFLGSLMEKASCSKDMDCTPNVSSNTEDGEDENFAGKKATNPFSISENLCFADFQRWQEIQTELMPQITTVECACNQVAVYFGLDKMLIGESGSGGDLVNRCLALLQTLPRVVRCSGNAKLHKCTMLYLSADLITGTKGLRAFTSKVPTSGTTLFSCLEKQIVMPLNPVKSVSFPSRSFLSPLSFWHLSAALLLCHWCDGVSAHCVTDMLTCALLVAMLLIIILPFIPACATQWILPLHCCSKCIFHRPRMYKLV